eukprot:UN12315
MFNDHDMFIPPSPISNCNQRFQMLSKKGSRKKIISKMTVNRVTLTPDYSQNKKTNKHMNEVELQSFSNASISTIARQSFLGYTTFTGSDQLGIDDSFVSK